MNTTNTPGDDSNSALGPDDDAESDEAASTTDDDGFHDDSDEDQEPVYDGEVLQEENTVLKQEMSELRDRLNHTKTELAFQQSRRPSDYKDSYFEKQLYGLRSQIRSWCASYFVNEESYWTMPAERRFKPLCTEWAAYLDSKSWRPWLIQARVWYILDRSLFNSTEEKYSSWLYLGKRNGRSIDKMFAQGQ